jgi:hypothetical protein
MSPRFFFLIAAAALALPACSADLGSETEGELGRANFAYAGSCFFGCAIDHPVLAGGRARISVVGKNLPELTARSSDNAVLTVETHRTYLCCKSAGDTAECALGSQNDTCGPGFDKSIEHSLLVRGHRAGSALVALVDAGGNEVDRLRLDVAAASVARVRLYEEKETRDVAGIELAKDGSIQLEVLFKDESGRALEAQSGVFLKVDDPSIASFDGGLGSVEQGTFLGTPKLVGRKAGTTTLRAIAGVVERTFTIAVK